MGIDFTDYPTLVAAARHGLGTAEAPVALPHDQLDRLLVLARFDHLSGMLASAAFDGAVDCNDSDLARILDAWHQELVACVRLEALAVRTGRILDEAAVEWRLTKGAALAHLDYPDPAMRTFGDIDLVIHPSHWDRAVGVLTGAGYVRQVSELGGGYDHRYGKGATLTSPADLEVDLHRRFAIGRFGVTSRMEDLFEARDTIELAGQEIPVLAPAHRLLHACYHSSLGGFSKLRAFRDVAQLILVSRVDWDETLTVARRWKAEAVVYSAIVESWRRLSLDEGHPAYQTSAAAQFSRGDRRALAVFSAQQPFRAQALTAVGRLGPRALMRYLWVLAMHHRSKQRGTLAPATTGDGQQTHPSR